jgi:hypothetical protein
MGAMDVLHSTITRIYQSINLKYKRYNMKKILSISLGLLLTGVTIAQSNDQIQNKKGEDLLPVKGEWAVGAGFNMLGYVGNMFNGSTNNFYGNSIYRNSGLGGTSLFGKYMISDNNAVRLSVFNTGYNNVTKYEVYDDRLSNPDSTVFDSYNNSSSTTRIGLGYEFRRGKSRLRGIYGGDALVGWSTGNNINYNYGNAMTYDNQAPYSTEFFASGGVGAQNSPLANRVLSVNNSNTFSLGVRGFVGVEYFVAPKICIGTEFGWSVNYSNAGKRTVVEEYYDIFKDDQVGGVVNKTTVTENGRNISSGLDNTSTQIYATFYF